MAGFPLAHSAQREPRLLTTSPILPKSQGLRHRSHCLPHPPSSSFPKTALCLWGSPSAGKTAVHLLTVTLEDLYNGATRKLSLQKNVICRSCGGEWGHGALPPGAGGALPAALGDLGSRTDLLLSPKASPDTRLSPWAKFAQRIKLSRLGRVQRLKKPQKCSGTGISQTELWLSRGLAQRVGFGPQRLGAEWVFGGVCCF